MSRRKRIPFGAAIISCAATLFLALGAWHLSKSRSYQMFGELVSRIETADSVLALTFDDGPVSGYTDSVLAILAEFEVQATFFVVGSALMEHPDLARRIVEAGHELGNHSYSHQRLVLRTPGYIRREIENTDALIRAAGQSGPIHFRPPYGKRLIILPWLLSQWDRTTVLWDLEPDSYPLIARDPEQIVNHVVENVRPGSIILLHVENAGNAPGRAALPVLIQALRAKGFQFMKISEFMNRANAS